MSIWVLTREINDYNQDGAYFERAWGHKPSIETLTKFFNGEGYPEEQGNHLAQWVYNGGGRQKYEHTWYNLDEV